MNFSKNRGQDEAPKVNWGDLSNAIFDPQSPQNQQFWNHFRKYWTNEEKSGVLRKVPMQYKRMTGDAYVERIREHRNKRNNLNNQDIDELKFY